MDEKVLETISKSKVLEQELENYSLWLRALLHNSETLLEYKRKGTENFIKSISNKLSVADFVEEIKLLSSSTLSLGKYVHVVIPNFIETIESIKKTCESNNSVLLDRIFGRKVSFDHISPPNPIFQIESHNIKLVVRDIYKRIKYDLMVCKNTINENQKFLSTIDQKLKNANDQEIEKLLLQREKLNMANGFLDCDLKNHQKCENLVLKWFDVVQPISLEQFELLDRYETFVFNENYKLFQFAIKSELADESLAKAKLEQQRIEKQCEKKKSRILELEKVCDSVIKSNQTLDKMPASKSNTNSINELENYISNQIFKFSSSQTRQSQQEFKNQIIKTVFDTIKSDSENFESQRSDHALSNQIIKYEQQEKMMKHIKAKKELLDEECKSANRTIGKQAKEMLDFNAQINTIQKSKIQQEINVQKQMDLLDDQFMSSFEKLVTSLDGILKSCLVEHNKIFKNMESACENTGASVDIANQIESFVCSVGIIVADKKINTQILLNELKELKDLTSARPKDKENFYNQMTKFHSNKQNYKLNQQSRIAKIELLEKKQEFLDSLGSFCGTLENAQTCSVCENGIIGELIDKVQNVFNQEYDKTTKNYIPSLLEMPSTSFNETEIHHLQEQEAVFKFDRAAGNYLISNALFGKKLEENETKKKNYFISKIPIIEKVASAVIDLI